MKLAAKNHELQRMACGNLCCSARRTRDLDGVLGRALSKSETTSFGRRRQS